MMERYMRLSYRPAGRALATIPGLIIRAYVPDDVEARLVHDSVDNAVVERCKPTGAPYPVLYPLRRPCQRVPSGAQAKSRP
jgi:hypothetical protein